MMKVVLFDADGVLTVPEELFSVVYARSHGLDISRFEKFFREVFPAALLGKADLKDLIRQHHDIWQGDPDVVLKQWLKSEDVRNEEALEIIRQLRQKGTKCYLATNQEKYRGTYMRQKMFKGLFDDYFISCEMGTQKPDSAFFEKALAKIQKGVPGLSAHDVLFFDDSPSHIEGAKMLGIDARLYKNLDQIKALLP